MDPKLSQLLRIFSGMESMSNPMEYGITRPDIKLYGLLISEVDNNKKMESIDKEYELKKEHLNKKVDCLDKGFVRLVDFMGTDSSIVQAARVSYGEGTSKKSRDRELIRYLMRHRHTSPFEHVEFKFHIKAPILVFRQLIRHRTASLNEISGRYSKLKDECYIPELSRLQTQSETNKQGSSNIELSEEEKYPILNSIKEDQVDMFKSYNEYLESGLSRELARNNLPVSTYSEIYWKIDLHNLFHFLKLRMSGHAQWEIRQFANAISSLIKFIVPVSYEAFEDYALDSVTFSRQEMEILESIIPTQKEFLLKSASEKNLKGLEKNEFFEKLKL
jgi:thymidylate synthase (FAD)